MTDAIKIAQEEYTKFVSAGGTNTFKEFLIESRDQTVRVRKEIHRQISVYTKELEQCNQVYNELSSILSEVDEYLALHESKQEDINLVNKALGEG